MRRLLSTLSLSLSLSLSLFPFVLCVTVFALYIPALFFLQHYHRDTTYTILIDGSPKRFGFPLYVWSDAQDYVTLTENLINHRTFSLAPQEPHIPDAYRTPGYVVIVAALTLIFDSYLAVSAFQIFLVALTGILLFKMGKRLLPAWAAFGAALLYVLDPAVIERSFQVMTDTLFVFLLMLAVYIVFFSVWSTNKTVMLGAGLILGSMILVRPVGVFVPGLLAIVYGIAKRREMSTKALLGTISLLLFGSTLVVGPWLIRNKKMFGVFNLASNGAAHMLFWNVSSFHSTKTGESVGDINEMFAAEAGLSLAGEETTKYPGGFGWFAERTSLRNSHLLIPLTRKYIMEDPVGYAKFHVVKTLPFFVASSIRNSFIYDIFFKKTQSPNLANALLKGEWRNLHAGLKSITLLTVERFGRLLIFLLGLIAIAFSWRRESIVLLCCALVLYFAVVTGPASYDYERFRLPAQPFMFLLGGMGAKILWDKYKEKLWLP